MSFLRTISLVFISTGLLFISSCRENILINADAVPEGDNILTNTLPDTVTIFTKSINDDSLLTSLSVGNTYHGVGRIANDPFFGQTNSQLYIQFVQPRTSYVLDTSAYVFDSLVMILPYSGFTYGDTSASAQDLTYEVRRLSHPMYRDTNYYSSSPYLQTESQVLGTATVPVKNLSDLVRDSIMVLGKNEPYHLRIKLDQSLLNTLLQQSQSSPFNDQPSFVEWLRGFCVSLADTNAAVNSIPFWRLNGDASVYSKMSMVLYHHSKDQSDTLKESFYFDPVYCGHFNKITHHYNASPIWTWFQSPLQSDSVIALQNQPGATFDLVFPHIKSLPKGAINKAELVITEIPAFHSNTLLTPGRIFPRGVDENGAEYTILDRLPLGQDEGLEFIDGAKRDVMINGTKVAQYHINFPRELQQAIFQDKDTLHLRISGASGLPGAYRLVAGGRTMKNTDVKMTLKIVYSNLNTN